MRFFHVVKRGKHFHYVQRIPQDLLGHFPKATVWKTLGTTDVKAAKVLAASMEQRTQQVFLQLRSGMLSKELEQRIVASYLQHGADRIESNANQQEYEPHVKDISPVDKVIIKAAMAESATALRHELFTMVSGSDEAEAADIRAEYLKHEADALQDSLKHKRSFDVGDLVDNIAVALKKELQVRLTDKEHKRLGMQLTDAAMQLRHVEVAALDGDRSLLRGVRSQIAASVQTPYIGFPEVVKKFVADYMTNNPDNNPRTKDAIEVGCNTLIEIFGRRSMEEINTREAATELKAILRKFPQNRVKHFGDKSLHSIIKHEKDYRIIKVPTANKYIGLMVSIVDYAIECKYIPAGNVYPDKRFKDSELKEEKRVAYDKEDIEKLVDALCTKPLWIKAPNRNDRFWIVLVALLQGFRLGEITGLTRNHIIEAGGVLCFDLTKSGGKKLKTTSSGRVVPVHPVLLEIGFAAWVNKIDGKLFGDTSKQVSVWYNRTDSGSLGFEPRYVTTDKRKCLYSCRHLFAGELSASGSEMKLVKDAMGHAADSRNITAGYIGMSRIENMLEAMDRMMLQGIDVGRLKQRAVELFGV